MGQERRSRNGLGFMRFAAAIAGIVTLALGTAASAQTPEPYAALAPLIGDWNVGPADAAPAFVERFSWGPGQSYIWVKVTLIRPSGEDQLHLEGIVVWNAASRRFDYLFAVEPGSLIQEQGEFRVDENGVIVREVVLTAADGATGRFRQTFRSLGDGRLETSLMRQTDGGWTPTFPGSERLTMVRRAG